MHTGSTLTRWPGTDTRGVTGMLRRGGFGPVPVPWPPLAVVRIEEVCRGDASSRRFPSGEKMQVSKPSFVQESRFSASESEGDLPEMPERVCSGSRVYI
jgi:hypothetical protein